jgi:hypothetical protein
MSKKTETEFRTALAALEVYSEDEIATQVEQALTKGTIVRDPAAPQAFEAEVQALDRAALAWGLEKAASHDEPDGDEGESEEDDEDEGESEEDDEDDFKGMQKALGEAIAAAVGGALAPLRRDIALVKGRVEAVGDLTKALVSTQRASLEKGGGLGHVMARLDAIERALTGPRGDFRGVAPGDFEPIPHPGDQDLKKGTSVDAGQLKGFLLSRQKAAQATDPVLAGQLHKALMSIDQTTTSEELAGIAQHFGFKA